MTLIKIDRIDSFRQYDPEWYQIRKGKMTGSLWPSVYSLRDGKFKAGASRWIYRIAAEIMTDQSEEEEYENYKMEWGKEVEPEARDWYAEKFKVEVKEFAFVQSSEFPLMGFSPDFYTKKGEVFRSVQVKSPYYTSIFLDAVLGGKYSPDMKTQCVFELALDQRLAGIDLFFFDPRIPNEDKQGHIVETFNRKELKEEIAAMRTAMTNFHKDVEGVFKEFEFKSEGK